MSTITAYHGTNARFKEFDSRKARIFNDFFGGGIAYFTDGLGVAKTYAKSNARSGGGEPIIYEVKLKLQKIFDVDHKFTGKELTKFFDTKSIDQFARGAKVLKFGEDKFTTLARLESGRFELTGEQVFKGLSYGMVNTAKAREVLEKLGYTGLRYNGGVNMNMVTKHNVYLMYRPQDIKITKVMRVVKKPTVSESRLNLSRDIMPQVGDDFLDHMVDLGYAVDIKTVKPESILSSQGEAYFDDAKVAAIQSTPTVLDTKKVIVSNDQYVVDGHHRWKAAKNLHRKLTVAELDMNINDALTHARNYTKRTKVEFVKTLRNLMHSRSREVGI